MRFYFSLFQRNVYLAPLPYGCFLFFPLLCRSFLVWWNPNLSIFALVCFAFGVRSKNSLPRLMLRSWSFTSWFIISGLLVKTLNNFESIFVYDVRQWSSLIVLCVAVQFSQQHWLQRLSFPPLYILAIFVVNCLTIYMWVYFWALYSIALICASGFMTMPYCFDYYSFAIESESRDVMLTALFSFLRIA